MTATGRYNARRRMVRKAGRLLSSVQSFQLPENFTPPCSHDEVKSSYVFVDGGEVDCTLPPMPLLAKPVKVLSICNGNLFVPTKHLSDPSKGLVYALAGSSLPVVITPPLTL